MQTISILYHPCCLKGMHYLRTVSISYQKYIQFFHIMSKTYPSNIPISHWVCVDESMSRWYGLGGDRVNRGLPHYVLMDRKPENGSELKTPSCRESGFLLRIEVV